MIALFVFHASAMNITSRSLSALHGFAATVNHFCLKFTGQPRVQSWASEGFFSREGGVSGFFQG